MTIENQAANVIGFGLSPSSLHTPHASSRSTQYYDLIMAAFVTVLLCASFMGPAKVADVGGIHFGAATLFFPIALYGILPDSLLMSMMLTNYVIKCGWEILATPLTYAVVAALKRAEGQDYCDDQTNFSPFAVRV